YQQDQAIGAFAASATYSTWCFNRVIQGVLSLRAGEVIDAARDLLITMPATLWKNQRSFAIVFGLLALLIYSIGGGAIARMSAVQFALRERMRVRQAVDFALGHWATLVWAQALPLLIVVIISV